MKILQVEDTRAVAAVLKARLTSFGHDAIVAENGQVAVRKFTESAPDLVLMDIEMPVMNGFEARRQWAWPPPVPDGRRRVVLADWADR